jgi:hydroxymethylbilane synthase
MQLPSHVAIGTRGSKLALTQTETVRLALQQMHAGLQVTAVRITTTGDRIQDRPLSQVGGKALFVTEIENALRDGSIQLAVHSAKDIPSDLPHDMRIAACLPRVDPRDALISRVSADFDSLPLGARVGTSSPRRACQLRSLRPDLELLDIRGNVDTRLAKLESGQFDAIVLAAAGLTRLGLQHHITQYMPFELMLPAGSQGAIAIEVYGENAEVQALVAAINDAPTSIAITAERAFQAHIGGSCDTPLAAHATIDGNEIVLHGMIGNAAGQTVRATMRGTIDNAVSLGTQLAQSLLTAGGAELLSTLDPSNARSQLGSSVASNPALPHVPQMEEPR